VNWMTAVETENAALADLPKRHIVIALPGKLDVNATIKLKPILAQALLDACPVMLNAAEVSRISTAACQLIAAFKKTMSSHGKRVTFQHPSHAFTRAFAILGLVHVLEAEL
jgi:anti-anti-sigma factor